MTPEQLRHRTWTFSVDVYRMARPMLHSADSRYVAQQLLRAACSVAANYRAACLGRSRAEFIAKLGIVREEADEALFWLEFAERVHLTANRDLPRLTAEAREITRIMAAAYRTTKQRRSEPPK